MQNTGTVTGWLYLCFCGRQHTQTADIEISISAPAARKKGLSPLDFTLMRQPLYNDYNNSAMYRGRCTIPSFIIKSLVYRIYELPMPEAKRVLNLSREEWER